MKEEEKVESLLTLLQEKIQEMSDKKEQVDSKQVRRDQLNAMHEVANELEVEFQHLVDKSPHLQEIANIKQSLRPTHTGLFKKMRNEADEAAEKVNRRDENVIESTGTGKSPEKIYLRGTGHKGR